MKLDGADLRYARLDYLDLRGMDLRTVKLRRALLYSVRYDDQTKWPRNFRPKRPRGNRRS